MMFWDGGGTITGWAVGMMLLMLLVWGSVVALVWVGIRELVQRRPDTGPRPPSPQEVLAHRLARGEIDPEEYRRRLAALDAPP